MDEPITPTSNQPQIAQALVAAAGDGLVAVDSCGCIAFVNPAAERIFGRSAQQTLGRAVHELLPPDTLQQPWDQLAASVHENESTPPLELTGQRPDGTELPLELRLTSAQVDGQPLVLLTFHDLRKRRQSDRQQHALMEQLTQAQKMRALGTLAAGVAHDFNNMLGAIMGYASAMMREVSPDHRHHNDVQQIMTIARRAKRLTDKLLAFSRRSSRKVEVFCASDVVRDVVSMLSRTIPKSIVLKTRLEREINLEGDRAQIEQALLNLCLNARDAMPEGGEIAIETRKQPLGQEEATPLGLAPGEYVSMVVRDSGVGMDRATLGRVFDPFFSTKPAGEGSGLGLSLVYNTVTSHGGHVQIDSQPEAGTVVTTYLPISASAPQPKPRDRARQETDHVQGHGERILLVDDEKHLRGMAKRLLEGLGYKVLLAESGEEAEAIYRDEHDTIDLVILDVVLVGLSSAETLARLKQIEPSVRVLLSSGHSREGEPKRLLRSGVCGFIQKPYGMEEVGQAINKALATSN